MILGTQPGTGVGGTAAAFARTRLPATVPATLSATKPAPATASSRELIAGEAIGAVQPGGRRFTTSPKAGHRAAPPGIHGDPAHVVVRRRANRDRMTRGINARRQTACRNAWESPPEIVAERARL